VGSGKPAGNRSPGAGEDGGESCHNELPAGAQSGLDRPLVRSGAGAMGEFRRACEKRHAGAHLGRHRPCRRADRRADCGADHHQFHANVVREFSIGVRPARGSKRRLSCRQSFCEQEISSNGTRKKRCGSLKTEQTRISTTHHFDSTDEFLRLSTGRSRRFGPLTKGLPRS
jgi:hypothetical protein